MIAEFQSTFVDEKGNLGRTQLLKHKIDIGNFKPITSYVLGQKANS